MRDRPALDLFLISWLVLFLELTCIRWFPSHVMFLTFFTNIVLLAAFVGMSVGCLAAARPGRLIERTPAWLVAAVGLGLLAAFYRSKLMAYIAVGDRANPDVVFFGAEAGDFAGHSIRVPLEVLGGLFFLLIAVVLIGPGQEMGRAFTRVPSRSRAYAANLLGSLAGIGSFALCSWLQLPPVVWFAGVAAGVGHFVYRPAPGEARGPVGLRLGFLAVVVGLSAVTSGFVPVGNRDTFWSPYYRIDYDNAVSLIETNLVGHQQIEPKTQVPNARHANYSVPYLLQRDVPGADGRPAWPPFKRVLIIGAGSGNDVSRSLQWLDKDAHIDAVEIDPVIYKLGAAHHPDKPYADEKRVTVHLNDGRNFLRTAPAETYDLVIFALVDSLVLHSGYSNLRLESYLFTLEAFQDARRVLKPTGVCAVYNYFRHGWLAARIRGELADPSAFGVDPVVFVLRDKVTDQIKPDDYDPDAFTIFLAGSAAALDPVRKAFADNGNWYWVTGDRPADPANKVERFGPGEPPALGPPAVEPPKRPWKYPPWVAVRAAAVETPPNLPPATDDWPFLYVREPGIPLVTWRGIALMVVLSLGLWFVYRPPADGTQAGRPVPPDLSLALRSFGLGAGFMLVETKAVVEMALLFGSTWTVNTVVFAAVLLMSLAGNLYAGWVKPKNLVPYYVGLFASLAVGLAVPASTFLGLSPAVAVAGSCLLAFGPVAFAGVIFATSFGRAARPDRVFGANVAGALVGGLAENASVLLGFRYLLCVAGGFYLFSALFGNRTDPTPDARPGL